MNKTFRDQIKLSKTLCTKYALYSIYFHTAIIQLSAEEEAFTKPKENGGLLYDALAKPTKVTYTSQIPNKRAKKKMHCVSAIHNFRITHFLVFSISL